MWNSLFLYGVVTSIVAPFVLLAVFLVHRKTGHNTSLSLFIIAFAAYFCYAIIVRKVVLQILPWLSVFTINIMIYRRKGFTPCNIGLLSASNTIMASTMWEIPAETFRFCLSFWLGSFSWLILFRTFLSPSIIIPIVLAFMVQKNQKKKRYFLFLAFALYTLQWMLWVPWLINYHFLYARYPCFPYVIRIPTASAFIVYPLATTQKKV